MGLIRYKLGDLIEQRREKYDGSDVPVRGVTRDGFIPPKQKVEDLHLYNMFYLNDFVFNPARMEINSIALNKDLHKGACSSLYEIFFVKRNDLVLADYLNLFFKRDEFARMCAYIGWGSAREYCRVANISELEIDLPPIEIQQKYVDIYNAMVANQKCYEDSLGNLKFACDAIVENIRKTVPSAEIGSYLIEHNERNEDLKLKKVQGVGNTSAFVKTKANAAGLDIRNYKIVQKGQFAYNPSRINLGSIALLDSDESCVVSPMYIVFEVDDGVLLPEFLMMWFGRKEFQRSTLFYASGSVRDTFSFEVMKETRLPIPDIKKQQLVIDVYKAYVQRKRINEKLKEQIKNICPILIKGSLEEARKS